MLEDICGEISALAKAVRGNPKNPVQVAKLMESVRKPAMKERDAMVTGSVAAGMAEK
jgi:hypothetical protein